MQQSFHQVITMINRVRNQSYECLWWETIKETK